MKERTFGDFPQPMSLNLVVVLGMHLLQTSNVSWSPEPCIAIDPNTIDVF